MWCSPDINGWYHGQIVFMGGPVINPDDFIDFTFSTTFTGMAISFQEQLTPIAVPEPGTLSLLLGGGFLLGFMTRRKA
jgi:hypothetical protein